MSNSRVLDPSPTALLRLSHRWIRELFKQLLHPSNPDRGPRVAISEALKRELRSHFRRITLHVTPHIATACVPIERETIGRLERLRGLSRAAVDDVFSQQQLQALERDFLLYAGMEERYYFPLIEHLPTSLQNDLALGIIRTKDEYES